MRMLRGTERSLKTAPAMTLAITVKLGTGALLLYGIPFIIIVGFRRVCGFHRTILTALAPTPESPRRPVPPDAAAVTFLPREGSL